MLVCGWVEVWSSEFVGGQFRVMIKENFRALIGQHAAQLKAALTGLQMFRWVHSMDVDQGG
jgi:hypothetical protein